MNRELYPDEHDRSDRERGLHPSATLPGVGEGSPPTRSAPTPDAHGDLRCPRDGAVLDLDAAAGEWWCWRCGYLWPVA